MSIGVFKMQENFLLNILKALNITQTKMAESLDMSRQQLNNIINKKGNFTIQQLQKMCTLYNVNLNYLITGKGSYFINEKNINSSLKNEILNVLKKY